MDAQIKNLRALEGEGIYVRPLARLVDKDGEEVARGCARKECDV